MLLINLINLEKKLCSRKIMVWTLFYHFLKIHQTSCLASLSLSFFICKILIITEITDHGYIRCPINTDLKASQNLKLEANFFWGRSVIFMEEKKLKNIQASSQLLESFWKFQVALSNFICLKIVMENFHVLKVLKVPLIQNGKDILGQPIVSCLSFYNFLMQI